MILSVCGQTINISKEVIEKIPLISTINDLSESNKDSNEVTELNIDPLFLQQLILCIEKNYHTCQELRKHFFPRFKYYDVAKNLHYLGLNQINDILFPLAKMFAEITIGSEMSEKAIKLVCEHNKAIIKYNPCNELYSGLYIFKSHIWHSCGIYDKIISEMISDRAATFPGFVAVTKFGVPRSFPFVIFVFTAVPCPKTGRVTSIKPIKTILTICGMHRWRNLPNFRTLISVITTPPEEDIETFFIYYIV